MADMKKVKRPVPVEKKRRTKLTPTNEERIKILLAERARLTEEMAKLKARTDEINAEALDIVQSLDGADETWEGTDDSGHFHRVKVVRPESIQYDEEELRFHLSSRVWNRITDQMLNIKSLQDAVVDGEVDADLVEQTRSVSVRKPYIKVTTK